MPLSSRTYLFQQVATDTSQRTTDHPIGHDQAGERATPADSLDYSRHSTKPFVGNRNGVSPFH